MSDKFVIGGQEFDPEKLNAQTKAECERIVSSTNGPKLKELYDQLMNDKAAYDLFMKQICAITVSAERAVPAFALLGGKSNLAKDAKEALIRAFHWTVRMRVTHQAVIPMFKTKQEPWDDSPPSIQLSN